MLLSLLAAAAAWLPLFDGHTSAGWLEVTGQPFPAESWTIEDGCLKARVKDGGFQDLRTAAEFLDFELEFDWKISSGGNSGVKYRIEKVDQWPAREGPGHHARGRGPEYQLSDDDLNPDSRGQPLRQTGSLYGKLAPASRATRPAGEFNQSRIVARQGHVEHWLNGVKVVEYDNAALRRGPIVLQNHHSEVWFRNLRIRALD